MIYFRKKEIELPPLSKEELESLINQKTAKITSMFDFTSTLGYVIPEEYPFAGKKLKDGSVVVSRFRHSMFFFSPRIVTKWRIKSDGNTQTLEIKNRFSLLSSLGFFSLSISALSPIVNALMKFRLPYEHEVSFELLICFGLLLGLTYYEIRTTDGLFEKILRGEKIKNIFSA